MDYTSDPTLAARLHRSPCSPALIAQLRARELRWSFCWRAVILVSMRLQVSDDIQA